MAMSGKEKMARHRAKVKAKLARLERYEAALREIAGDHEYPHNQASVVARFALNAEAEA